MNINNLKCRCGSTNDWNIEWSMSIEWELQIICEKCGAVHTIAHANNYNAKVNELKGGPNK